MKTQDDFHRSCVPRQVATLVLLTLTGCTTPPAPPADSTLPLTLRTPKAAVLEETLTATGDSVFQCRRLPSGLQWRYQGSQAILADPRGYDVGTVTPGGYFVGYDGSYAITRVDAQEPVAQDSLPWALLTSRFNAPSQADPPGLFSKTTFVQRVATKGGLPAEPDCTTEGTTQYIHYTATYMLYRLPVDATPAVPSSPTSDNNTGMSASPPATSPGPTGPTH